MTENRNLRAGWIDVTTLSDCVDRAAERWQHDAIVFPHERATFPEFSQRIDHFARGLLALDVGYRDKVGILLPQGIDYYALLVGAAKIGAVPVPINARYKSVELRHVITNSDMRVLFTSDATSEFVDFPALVAEALPSLREAMSSPLSLTEAPRLRHVVQYGSPGGYAVGAEAFAALANGVGADAVQARRYMVRVRDTAVLMYTSGTTANPKGAMLSHEALVREGVTVARTRFDLTPDERVWTPLPLYHIGGVAFAFACWAAGATYCHSGAFDPGMSLRQLADERCTIAIPAFETIWLAVLNHPDFESADLSALRIIFNVGVPERLRSMQERLPGATQVSGFGSTEACSFLSLGTPDEPLDARVSTTGRPLPGVQVRVVDPETRADLPRGSLGEIAYRGWSTFDGYYNAPERNAEVFDADGWFYSGDLGVLDVEGRLRFVGRLKDMLKVGGENVAAAEVEGYLLTHPAVLLAQVVAAPDARYVEVPAAFIQLQPGATATEQELIDFCLGKIATFKVPRYVRFVDDWPMSGTKIRKYVLRERIAAELAERGITEAPRPSPAPVAG